MSEGFINFLRELKIADLSPDELKAESKKEYLKKWSKENPEKIKEYRRKWREENEKKKEFKIKRSQKTKIECTIQRGEFIIDFEYDNKEPWKWTGQLYDI